MSGIWGSGAAGLQSIVRVGVGAYLQVHGFTIKASKGLGALNPKPLTGLDV